MEPIDINNCKKFGRLIKTHGLNGELVIIPEEGLGIIPENINFVFVLIEGGLVPFFLDVENQGFIAGDSALIKFDDLDSREHAKEIAGCDVYVFSKGPVIGEDACTANFNGYSIVDNSLGLIGPVIETNNFSGNSVVTVMYKSTEVMIPLSEGIVESVNQEEKVMHIVCPVGLLDIYQ